MGCVAVYKGVCVCARMRTLGWLSGEKGKITITISLKTLIKKLAKFRMGLSRSCPKG